MEPETLTLHLYPHQILREEAVPVSPSKMEELKPIFPRIFELMYSLRGLGLAAPQVGLNLQFFVLNMTGDPAQKDKEKVFFNPHVISTMWGRPQLSASLEGCLSFPGLYANIPRPQTVKIAYHDERGRARVEQFTGPFARAVLHEYDHLHGRLFLDTLPMEYLLKLREKNIDHPEQVALIERYLREPKK